MGYDKMKTHRLDLRFKPLPSDYGLGECNLTELLLWLERSEETGYYMGYSRHAIAMAYNKRVRYLQDVGYEQLETI